MAKALLDYGRRVEASVFVATLDDGLRERMLERVRKLISADEDVVHVFPLCGACWEKVVTMGRAEVPEDEDFYVI